MEAVCWENGQVMEALDISRFVTVNTTYEEGTVLGTLFYRKIS